MRNLASRPIAEFSRFEALDLLEAIKNSAKDTNHEKANYYRLTYETLRSKINTSDEQFRELLLPLLGDKDHERILDIVAKVEKNYRRRQRDGNGPRRASANSPYGRSVRCFYCNKMGHTQNTCFKRKKDLGEPSPGHVGPSRERK
jgi:hypothetical protein